MNMMVILWIVVFVIMLVAEAATAGLISLWFAGGALLAMAAALLGAALIWQLVIFVVASGVLMALIYPRAKKKLRDMEFTPTNADRIIGMDGVLTEAIDPLAGTGAVRVDGKIWTARSEDSEVVPAGAVVTVLRIEGVRAIVTKKSTE